MASKVLKKINAKLKFLYRQSRYLTSASKRLLWMFLMVSVFKEKFKIQSSKSSKQMFFFLPKFISEISYRSILLQNEQNTTEQNTVLRMLLLSNGKELYQDTFMKCLSLLCRYSISSQIALDIPLWKTNTGQKSLSLLGPKIWSKINPSIKNVNLQT